MFRRARFVLVSILILSAWAAQAADTSGDIPLIDEKDHTALICLGPVGVRVKTDTPIGTSADSQSNSATVKFIYSGTPAEGQLLLDDEIIGVNGEQFDKNFSRKMAAAIDTVEGKDGNLKLNVKRAGKPLEVRLRLPVIGTYSATFPYNCKKSDWVLESACDWLVRHMDKTGRLDQGGYIVNSAVGGLALLGTANPKYFPLLQKLAETLVKFFDKELKSPLEYLSTWQVNYGAIFLSEYYLATHDASVLPTLKLLNAEIRARQLDHVDPKVKAGFESKKSEVPPFWFGHQLPSAKDGYACLGVNVANALLAWRLISECGVPIDQEHYNKTRDYVQLAGPSGEMPYAGAPNQRGGDGDAFGRTGVLAVAYHLCNDRPEHMAKIAGALKRLQKDNYFTGHASSDLGKMWGSFGMAVLDPALFRESMDAHKYDYCLVRLVDGSFAANPEVHFQNGGSNNDFSYGRVWTTAFNALLFALSKQKMRITGKSLNGGSTTAQAKAPVPTEAGKENSSAAKPTALPPAPDKELAKEVLERWQKRFVKKLQSLVTAGTKLNIYADGKTPQQVRGASDSTLTVVEHGTEMPMPWRFVNMSARAALAAEIAKDEDLESLLTAAVFWAAAKNTAKSEDCFARAHIKDTTATEAVRKELYK